MLKPRRRFDAIRHLAQTRKKRSACIAVALCWNCDRADPGDASAARHVVEITRTGGAAPLLARVRQGGTPERSRGGRKEASEVAGPNREEDAEQAQATEEDLARQVIGSPAGSSATIG